MLSEKDRSQLKEKGISLEKFNWQLHNFEQGFPFLEIKDAATSAKGIKVLDETARKGALQTAEMFSGSICKLVPASGAATRMFKDLFEALSRLKEGGKVGEGAAEKFILNIHKFPFFDARHLFELTLHSRGLNYGAKPKGLIEFHAYEEENRTAFEEQLVEGALYARGKDGKVKMVVTVSPEHLEGFRSLLDAVKEKYEKRFNCIYEIEFTMQSPATDIVAVDMENKPFRKGDGSLLFRPGGHGALLENLNQIDSDIVIIKNIDNVVKESLVAETVRWKKILTGRALALQEKVFYFLRELEKENNGEVPDVLLEEIRAFMASEFCVEFPAMERVHFIGELQKSLNRPIRVCGMVKNEGEPGGGPYIVLSPEGITSLQILEEAQIDKSRPAAVTAVKNATHFNPVDLVCAVKDYKGKKFDLQKYSDPLSGFISAKSYEGRALKAQELPGLWNGAMSDWNTQFIEVPLITFNPVKTVLDLLREPHCGSQEFRSQEFA